jgi:predicted ATPase
MITSITFNKNKDRGYIYNPKYKKVLKKEFEGWTEEQINEYIAEAKRTHQDWKLGRRPKDYFYKEVRDGYELPHLVKNLGEKTITFDPDKINVLFGPNGCGKSTIIKELANYCLCGDRFACDGFTNPYHLEPVYLNGSIFDEDKSTKYTLSNYRKSLSQDGKRNDVSVVWDGGAVFNENISGRRTTGAIGDLVGGLFTSDLDEFIYLANRGQMSLGQNTIYMINKLAQICENVPTLNDFENVVKKNNHNDSWYKTGCLALKHINEHYRPGAKMTLLLDEMDKSLDIENTLLLYRDYLPALQKKFNIQIILVSHSPIMLTNIVQDSPNYNFISIDKKYTKQMKELFKGVSFN